MDVTDSTYPAVVAGDVDADDHVLVVVDGALKRIPSTELAQISQISSLYRAHVLAADHGFAAGASHAVNGAALTAAAAAAGVGGLVQLPSGTCNLLGAEIARGVTVRLHPDTILVGDETSTTPMIRNVVIGAAGTISTGSAEFELDSAAFTPEPGDVAIVREGGPMFDGTRLGLYAIVESVSGTTVTLDRAAENDATVLDWGVQGVVIDLNGGVLDGDESDAVNVNHFPVRLTHARNCAVLGPGTIRNCDHGGVMIRYGSRDNIVRGVTFDSIGTLAGSLGAAVWLFAACEDNDITHNVLIAGAHGTNGVICDDRSTGGDEYMGPSNGNTIAHNLFVGLPGTAVEVDGGGSNKVEANDILDCTAGIAVRDSTQGTTGFNLAPNNQVTLNRLTDCTTGISLAVADGSTVCEANTFDNCTTEIDGTPWIAVSGGIGFANSWVDYGAPFVPAEYRKHPNGDVELRGSIKDGTVGGGAFTLPAGYRPPGLLPFATCSNSAFGQLEISSAGVVMPVVGNNAVFHLNGVRFSTATAA